MQANQHIKDLSPYVTGAPIEQVTREYGIAPENIIKLASNENPLGMSPMAAAAMQAAASSLHRYPEQYTLLQAISKKNDAAPNQIVLGNGSNDVLDLIARTFLAPKDNAISSQYAFAIYAIATQSAGANNIIVPAKNFGHDLPAMLSAISPQTKIVWIANPNNPTGTFIPPKDIYNFIKQVPPQVVIVLDEAYLEYLAPNDRAKSINWIAAHPNLICVRTFSKIYGLAGLRIGYGIAAPEVADLLNRVRQPFNANNLAIAAAIAALKDEAFVTQSYNTNKAGMQQVKAGLNALKIEHLPAHGNFITIKVAGASKINQKLLQRGVIVRPLAGYGMPDYMRVTIGTKAENTKFITALSEVTKLN